MLTAWRTSPTRFREDANAESDLVRGGYADRLVTELASNAADAAQRAGRPGRLRLAVVRGQLHAANTGAPLDADGVAALTALRASAKRASGAVGRFGVGFAAVLPVSHEPRIVSTTGGVACSAERTAAEIAEDPRLGSELAARGGTPPVLRLAWPACEPGPPLGFDTEVRLAPRPGVDLDALLDACAAAAADLLLALDWLTVIEIGDRTVRREGHDPVVLVDGDRITRWRVVGRAGRLTPRDRAGLGPEAPAGWRACWALPVDPHGAPAELGADVLHAPTPTQVRMSLPARLIADVPVEPDRRRIAGGPAADAVLDAAAAAYPDLAAAVDTAERTDLVPQNAFPASDVDATLRQRVLATLRDATWLPAAAGTEVAASAARVLDVPLPDLAALLAGADPGLLAAELAEHRHARALAALGVPRLGPADVVELLAALQRPPDWWRRCYAALAPLAEAGPVAREELGGLPVPLADGRTVTGPRGVLLPAEHTGVDAPGLRLVHPDAAHPLLERLGARRAGPDELLDALRPDIEASIDADDPCPLVRTALALAALAAAGTHRPRPWLGALALSDSQGQRRRADELLLPGAALGPLLVPDAPLGVLHDDVAAAHRVETLRAVGVLDGFAVLDEPDPSGPDHDLDDEQAWWSDIDGDAAPPERLLAVRDLDLVDEGCWPAALRLLGDDPAGAAALAQPGGYTGWWLARHARLGGRAPTAWALPGRLRGLYDPAPVSDLPEWVLTAAGVRDSLSVAGPDDAADVLARLADANRAPSPALVHAAHAALGAADLNPGEIEPPDRVRAVTGAVVSAERALVLDAPWLRAALAPDELVAGGDPAALADLLDLPLASQACHGELLERSIGRAVPWASLPEIVAACAALGRHVPPGEVVLHDELRARVDGAEHAVPYWVSPDGTVHAADPLRALLRP